MAVYIELKGTFVFAINESGLDYNNPEERQQALDDFKTELGKFVGKTEDEDYVGLDYDENDIEISEGEE